MWFVTRVLSGGVPYQILQQNLFYKGCILMASLMYEFTGDYLTMDALLWMPCLFFWLDTVL